MINFDEYKKTEEENILFLPFDLAMETYCFLYEKTSLVKESLITSYMGHYNVAKDEELSRKRHEAFIKDAEFWENSPYDGYPERKYGAILGRMSEEDLHRLITKFFNGTESEDDEVKSYREKKNTTPLVYNGKDSLDDDDFLDISSLDGSKLKSIGTKSQFKKLDDLLIKRELTQDDIELILRTVKLK